jgi:hypothetical protein
MEHQDQPGAPDPMPAGVDPATADPASPSTVPAGTEHEAGPALDPGQATEQRSPATVTPAPAAAETASDEGYVSSRPLLMIGAAGDEVAELGYLLAAHGFPNAISEGAAAAPPILDDALMRTVVEFQQANSINPYEAEGDGAPILRQGHLGVVDARTWEALLGYKPKLLAPGAAIAADVKPGATS